MKILTEKVSTFKKKFVFSKEFNTTNRLLLRNNINTICHSARCPNINECFSKKKLTFLILGDTCTRHCDFCNVKKGKPKPVDKKENQRIIEIIKTLQLKYIVITSVTRDDLSDQGCSVYLDIINDIKAELPDLKIEVLIPDFKGDLALLKNMAYSNVDIIGHNIETINRLYPIIRPMVNFNCSLDVLRKLKEINPTKLIKTGFMVGLGEDLDEIKHLLKEIYENKVDIVTIGQYFQPSLKNYQVEKYYSDEEFKLIYNYAKEIGFSYVSSGRFVRSSYYAEEILTLQ